MSLPLLQLPPRQPTVIELPRFIKSAVLRDCCLHCLRGIRHKPVWIVGSAILALLATLPAWLPVPSPVWSNEPEATIEVCRAGVEPCQRELKAAVGEPLALDLFINIPVPDQGNQPRQLVAWETHFVLSGDGEIRLVRHPKGDLPVREQGHSRYALEGLVRLEEGSQAADYYTVQNLFDEEAGRLDYTVTQLPSERNLSSIFSILSSGQDRWLIGQVVLEGLEKGSIQVAPDAESSLPFQAISLTEAGERLPIRLSSGNPIATVDVGSPGETLDLEGRVPGNASAGSSSMELIVTFWHPQAVPPWRQGSDEPVAIFREIILDGNGGFRIADISPTILPPGHYDVRVKGRHTLGSRASLVTIPPSDSTAASPALAVEWGSLRFGDADDNHVVDAADLEVLKASFGRKLGESRFDSRVNFNADQVVDGQDFSLLAENYLSSSR